MGLGLIVSENGQAAITDPHSLGNGGLRIFLRGD